MIIVPGGNHEKKTRNLEKRRVLCVLRISPPQRLQEHNAPMSDPPHPPLPSPPHPSRPAPRRVNDRTGERTYQFIRGLPVNPSRYPRVSAYAANMGMMVAPSQPWGYGMPSPGPSPSYGGGPSPGYGGGPSPGYPAPGPAPALGYPANYSPYEAGYGLGAPPVTQSGDGSMLHRLQKYYIRPSSDQSWMWS